MIIILTNSIYSNAKVCLFCHYLLHIKIILSINDKNINSSNEVLSSTIIIIIFYYIRSKTSRGHVDINYFNNPNIIFF